MLLLVAGHETTRNLIGNGLATLLRHPREWTGLRRDPTLTRSAVEEFLRFECPFRELRAWPRWTWNFTGRKSWPVSPCSPCWAAPTAMRQFPDPDRLDLARKNNAHLTFGAGAHACLGLHLARLETQIAIPALLERYSRIELKEDDPPWSQTLTLRGLKRLNVILHA